MPQSNGLFAASGAALALVLALVPSPPALAEARVGVAAAVTPEATSVPPGAPPRTLKIGKSILYNERIDTSGTGVVQVLLLDGSTFTVGPNSNLVIDKFVYDPPAARASSWRASPRARSASSAASCPSPWAAFK